LVFEVFANVYKRWLQHHIDILTARHIALIFIGYEIAE